MANSALKALIFSLLVICGYVALRFDPKFAVPVLIALFHDILITAGVYSLTGKEVSSGTVAAFLTILGYSLYDTIIVFDRIRENVPRMPRAAFSQIVNRSMSEVLTRSLATSFSTLLAVGSLLVFGGATLQDFAFAMLVGIASGTYSSIFIASPVLTAWKEREPGLRPAPPADRRGRGQRSGLRRRHRDGQAQQRRRKRSRDPRPPSPRHSRSGARSPPPSRPATAPTPPPTARPTRPRPSGANATPSGARGARRGANTGGSDDGGKRLMALLVWFTMGIALWHFTVFLPDHFWQGIVGAFLGSVIGAIVFGLIVEADQRQGPRQHRPGDGADRDPGRRDRPRRRLLLGIRAQQRLRP